MGFRNLWYLPPLVVFIFMLDGAGALGASSVVCNSSKLCPAGTYDVVRARIGHAWTFSMLQGSNFRVLGRLPVHPHYQVIALLWPVPAA